MADVFKAVLFMLDAAGISVSANDDILRDLPCIEEIRAILAGRTQARNHSARQVLSLHSFALAKGLRDVYVNVHDAPVEFIKKELDFVRWLNHELLDLSRKIHLCVSDPEYELKEHIMNLVRTTLCADRWFEFPKKKRPRSYAFKRYIHMMWHIEMGYRLLHRREAILVEPSEDADSVYPAWQDLRYFMAGDSFPVYFTGDSNVDVPIAKWSHDRVYTAFRMLCRVRTMPMLIHTTKELSDIHKVDSTFPVYVKGISFQSQRFLKLYHEYVCALMDRMAVLAFYPVIVPSDLFATEFPLWFTQLSRDAEVDEVREKMGIVGGRIDILKRVRKHRETEDEKIRKSTGYDVTMLKKVSRQERIEIVKKALDKEMNSTRGMERDLEAMRYTLIELDKTATMSHVSKDDKEWDAAEAVRVRERIVKLEHDIAIKKEEDAKHELEEAEKLTGDVMRLLNLTDTSEDEAQQEEKLVEDNVNVTEEGKKTATVMLVPADPWYTMNMSISDSVRAWVVHQGLGIAPPNISHIKRVVVDACLDYIRKVDDSDINRAKQWIIAHGLSLWEREHYRMDLEGETHISLHSVWQSLYRTSITPDSDDTDDKEDPGDKDYFGVNDELPRFPKTYTGLLDDRNVYNMLGRAYIGWFYLYQVFADLEIDRWFFYWEFENELHCLDHPDVKGPVMTKIGCEWAVLKPFSWKTSEPNVIWCGYDFFDCLSLYLEVLDENDWLIHRRGSYNDIVDFRGTELHELYVKAMSRHTNLLSA